MPWHKLMIVLRDGLMMASLMCIPAGWLRADRIILRNLDVISDQTVESFDVDGVRLGDGRVIGWDRIEKGRVTDARQGEFDRMLSELGSHLYRIRQRLSIGDYRGLLTPAEAVYERYTSRRSETAYMVSQALMWARMAHGRREAALQPYLDALECLRQAADGPGELALPGTRRLRADLETGLSPELSPVWFDAQAAQKNLDAVGATISGMPTPRPPATRVYYATLALAAGQPERAAQALAGLEALKPYQRIIEAQMLVAQDRPEEAVAELGQQIDQFTDDARPLALYWLGQARLALDGEQVREAGLLDLLRIAPLYGAERPELAAAGLYRAMRVLGETENFKGSIAIRRELLDRYARTWHAEQLRTEDEETNKSP